MRTKNSCRFKTHYKLELRDERSCVWRPINKSFATIGAARDYARTVQYPTRVLRVSERGGYEILHRFVHRCKS